MSEPIAGIPPPPPAGKVRDAAAVILFRRTAEGVEVFWVRRERTLAFAAGFYAFPGGRVDATDATVPVQDATGEPAALRVAAARELLEETGVLVAAGAERLSGEQVAAARKELLEKQTPFAQILDRHGLTLRAADFIETGRWITPPFLPVRFDARFFLVEAPPWAQAEHWAGELAAAEWVAPKEGLSRWQKGTALLHPPNLYALEVMSRFRSVDEAAAELRSPPHVPAFIASRIEFQRGVRIFPLETPTLPPATHTNAYVVGNGELLIVDPGASVVRQYARLLALISGLKAEGKRPLAVVLTHHHSDHVGGAQAVKERLGVQVWCHARTAERLAFKPDRLLEEGDLITLSGMPPMKLRVLHTPGHARGHLCLVDEASKAALVGDMVAGVGTIVIDPPEGDMTDYLDQLRRLRDLPVGALYPAHGPAIPDGQAKLTEYLRHREERERKVLEALTRGGASLPELVPKAYDDVDPTVFPIAERSAQAILIKLVREGKVTRREDRYFPV